MAPTVVRPIYGAVMGRPSRFLMVRAVGVLVFVIVMAAIGPPGAKALRLVRDPGGALVWLASFR
jgi:hypothetical protein